LFFYVCGSLFRVSRHRQGPRVVHLSGVYTKRVQRQSVYDLHTAVLDQRAQGEVLTGAGLGVLGVL
jgi:hypothetical protein